MRAENQPVATEGAAKSEEGASGGDRDHTPQSRGRVGSTSSIIRKLMEKVVKPKPQTIHSSTISEEERHSTLAPFAMPGISIEKVNRDYEAFFKTAWGPDASPSTSKSSVTSTPQTPAFCALPTHVHAQAELDHREQPHSKRERRTDQPSRPQRPPANGGRLRAFTAEDDLSESRGSVGKSPPRSPQLRKAKQLNTPEVGHIHV